MLFHEQTEDELDEMAKRQALPISERAGETETLAEYTYSKFASTYFQSNSRPEFERRLLKKTLLSSTIIAVLHLHCTQKSYRKSSVST